MPPTEKLTARIIFLEIYKTEIIMKYLGIGFLSVILSLAVWATDISPDDIESLHQEAKQAFFAADYETALKKWQTALHHARSFDKQADISKFLVNLGAIHYNLGEYQKAIDYYQQAVEIDRKVGNKSGESAILGYLGHVVHLLGQHKLAVDYYQQALAIQQALGDKTGQSDSLTNIGIVYDGLHQYQTALIYYEQALVLKQEIGELTEIAKIISHQGVAYKNLSDYSEALRHFEKALEIQQEIQDQNGIANSFTNLGTVYDSLGQHIKAIEYYKKALKIHRALNDSSAIAANLTNLAVTYDNLGQHLKALGYYQQALKIQQQLGDIRGIGNTLSNVGIVYKNLGSLDKALAHYQQALKIHPKIDDKYGEANTLTNLGVIYDKQGQYPKALTHYLQALAIQEQIGDKQRIANNLSNLGVLYYNLGQADKALGYFLNALTIRREIGDKRGEGLELSHLGAAYDSQGLSSKAVNTYLQALEIKRDIGDKRGEHADLSHLGAVYATLEKYQQALTHFKLALVLDREVGDQLGEALDLSNIGLVHQQLGHDDKARKALQESVRQLESLGASHLWYAQRGLASIEAHFKEFEVAVTYYEQALNNIEQIRVGLTAKTEKLSFMQDKVFVYDELINLLQHLHTQNPNQGYDRKALEIFERKQGRIFLEEIGKSGAQRFARLPAAITKKEQKLTQQVVQTQAKLVQARNKPFIEQNNNIINMLTQRLTSLQAQQQTFQTEIKVKYPQYYALKYPQPATVATLQQLLQLDELILVYNVMPENTTLWLISSTQFVMLTLPVSEEQFYEDIAYLRDVILNRLPELVDEAYPLYQRLFPKSIHQFLTEVQTLYLVPTGPLYLLPFEALVTKPIRKPAPHYLIEDHAVVYLSSASLLKVLRDTKAQRQIQPPKTFLAFANPAYPLCDEESAERTIGRTSTVNQLRSKAYRDIMGAVCFPRLPETAEEANTIAALFQNSDSSLYLGEQANHSTVLNLNQQGQMADYRYLLFAVHGLLPYEVQGLAQASLVLSNSEMIEYLTMAEAFNLQLNADFINLSACNTGGGEQIKGEGIMGLTRAFMYAGTLAISVTLWSVESASAENLSIGIFANLKNGLTPAEAVRQIKLKMIAGHAKEPYYRHPFYWAPFVLYGNGS
jgi:tetratricopeptide (TPR) repeat protein